MIRAGCDIRYNGRRGINRIVVTDGGAGTRVAGGVGRRNAGMNSSAAVENRPRYVDAVGQIARAVGDDKAGVGRAARTHGERDGVARMGVGDGAGDGNVVPGRRVGHIHRVVSRDVIDADRRCRCNRIERKCKTGRGTDVSCGIDLMYLNGIASLDRGKRGVSIRRPSFSSVGTIFNSREGSFRYTQPTIRRNAV